MVEASPSLRLFLNGVVSSSEEETSLERWKRKRLRKEEEAIKRKNARRRKIQVVEGSFSISVSSPSTNHGAVAKKRAERIIVKQIIICS